MSANSNFFQNRSIIKGADDVLVTPTYNLAEYGKDLFIPLNSVTTTSTFTNSTATILRNTFSANSATGEEIDDYPSVIASEDTLLFWHAGDDTSYNRIFRYSPDAEAILSKAYMNIAFIVNISAFTSGTLTFDSVDVSITQRRNDDGRGDQVLFINNFVTGHGTLGAATADIFILSTVFGDINLDKNLPLDFHFTINVTEATKMYTYQTGIIPFFSYNPANVVKPYSLSGIGMHLNTDFDNSQNVMRKAGSTTKNYFINDFGTPKAIGT